jgi:cysteine desulfurase / selenocysteine lyase
LFARLIMIYLDNAATSFPKPKASIERVNDFLMNVGGNPGRSGHALSLQAARIIFEARKRLTAFVGARNSERLIFTGNGTESLNLAILGLVRENSHVITTSLEHNSVMRPLMFLQKERGVAHSVAPCGPDATLDPDEIRKLLRKDTRAVIVNHGSNVAGTVQRLKDIRSAIDTVTLIVDACQTIGSFPLDVDSDGIDVLCFSCHKSLYAMQGLGALYVKEGIDLTPLKFGGTGSKSESLEHPDFLPDKYECGTPNTPGIASLLGGLTFIEETGAENIFSRKRALRHRLVKGLSQIDGITLYGPPGEGPGIPVVSFNVQGKLSSEVGRELDRNDIYVRVGLHCSPLAHRTIGTFPQGTVRVSPGYFTRDEEIDRFLGTLATIAH